MSAHPQVKFRTKYICLKCGHSKEGIERTCPKCGVPLIAKAIKRTGSLTPWEDLLST